MISPWLKPRMRTQLYLFVCAKHALNWAHACVTHPKEKSKKPLPFSVSSLYALKSALPQYYWRTGDMVSQSFWAREFLIYGFKPPQDQQLNPKGVTDTSGFLKLKCSCSLVVLFNFCSLLLLLLINIDFF